MWQEHPAGYSGVLATDADSAVGEAVRICLRRIRGWGAPPNWALFQWREEIGSIAMAAACDAQAAYDPARGVPFGAFLYRRIMARVLTRYRQEWSFARRCVCELGAECEQCADGVAPESAEHCDLDAAMAVLSAPQRWLLDQLFWGERTESAVAAMLGLSQRGVSKRKQAVLRRLRRWLKDREK